MTEADWNTCTDPLLMLRSRAWKVSDRKLGLFAAACCRLLWGAATDEPTCTALSLVDHLAEAPPRQTTHSLLQVPAGQVVLDCGARDPWGPLYAPATNGQRRRVNLVTSSPYLRSVLTKLSCSRGQALCPETMVMVLRWASLAPERQADMLREVICPQAPAVQTALTWLANGIVQRLAEGRLFLIACARFVWNHPTQVGSACRRGAFPRIGFAGTPPV